MSYTPFISKTKFLEGMQCSKLLWTSYNAKNLFSPVEDSLQAIFDEGRAVGELAKKMFPDGIEIEANPSDLERTIQLTQAALSFRRPIFEAAASARNGFARADILKPVEGDSWDLIEVKATTRLKDIHIPDVAFQRWVFSSAGIKIRRCILCHISNEFVRHGEIDPNEFFTFHDVTAELLEFSDSVERQLREMENVIQSAKCPTVQIGKHCDSPRTCSLHDHCWSFLPPQNVLELYFDTKGRGFDLLNRGVLRMADIPEEYPLSDNQKIQRSVATSGQPHVKREQVRHFLKNLQFPLHFLDFETFSTAIPLFDGTWPYQQIPFQFSLHVTREAGASPEHRKFLAEGRDDPRSEFMRRLQSAVEPHGSIVVFNAAFEKQRLTECAEALPEHGEWVAAIKRRMVDLLIPFRGFLFYHPEQRGSASIKQVLPALTGRNYDSLEIQEGGEASREFLRITFADVSDAERQLVRHALDEYCGQDTEGMVWILDALRNCSLT